MSVFCSRAWPTPPGKGPAAMAPPRRPRRRRNRWQGCRVSHIIRLPGCVIASEKFMHFDSRIMSQLVVWARNFLIDITEPIANDSCATAQLLPSYALNWKALCELMRVRLGGGIKDYTNSISRHWNTAVSRRCSLTLSKSSVVVRLEISEEWWSMRRALGCVTLIPFTHTEIFKHVPKKGFKSICWLFILSPLPHPVSLRRILCLFRCWILVLEVIGLASFNPHPQCTVVSRDSLHISPEHKRFHSMVVASKVIPTHFIILF